MYRNKCELIEKNLCTGCTRSLAERDWIGPEQCDVYKRRKNTSNFEIAKKIIEGIQERL